MKTDPGTQSWLRAHNDRAALRLLLDHGPLSRAQLGELSGMSKPTARQMVARLERIGLIAPVGQVTGQRGPNAVAYGVRADTITGVAISMLADSIQAVGVDPTGTEHEIVEIPTTGRHRSPAADVTAAVAAACTAAGLRPDSVSVVAIGVQAAVDEAADSLSLTDTLPGWPAQGARAELEAATGLTVILENDVNLATMAERVMGVAKEATEFAYLWVGHGIGLGIDLGGTVHRGAAGGAGEIGYLEVPRSATDLDPDADDFTDLLGGPHLLAQLGREQDCLERALPLLTERPDLIAGLADRITLALQPTCAVLDPGLIVLGGPTCLAAGASLAELVAQRMAGTYPGLRVELSGVGDQPVLLGARRLLVATLREELETRISQSIEIETEGES
ncbi:putative NBD/HSP70 family sugar kinase [Propionicimonas paludicola]|uniref:Putative NBD/HSP70 family sugar kinase n=1 Tax=Propionicimonas paludicola TaxID=185243 RepID=A0A2A9CMY3_9ACTN|nr:ROK family protein [Propionicimonas paludicola]PFG15541.1 putative NBD/HSP70 family sugar kinase [Propionicimonas paludicola]